MARLPNSDRAVLDLRKIEDYCLSPVHPRGRHAARVFRQALGIDRTNAKWLREALLATLPRGEAIQIAIDGLGSRWRVDMPIERHGHRVMVRTIWIVRAGEDMPRFVTCWVL